MPATVAFELSLYRLPARVPNYIAFLNIETDIAGFLVTGFLVFLPGDIIKCLAASLIAIKVRPVLPA